MEKWISIEGDENKKLLEKLLRGLELSRKLKMKYDAFLPLVCEADALDLLNQEFSQDSSLGKRGQPKLAAKPEAADADQSLMLKLRQAIEGIPNTSSRESSSAIPKDRRLPQTHPNQPNNPSSHRPSKKKLKLQQ